MMRVSAVAAVAALAGSVACNSTPTTPNIISGSGAGVSGYISSFATVVAPTISGILHGGSVSVVPGGPSVTPTGATVAVNGGGLIMNLQSTGPFQHVFVQIGPTGTATAPTGFYEIDLAAPVTNLQVLVDWATTLPANVATFPLQFLVTDVNGLGGPVGSLTMTVVASVITSAPSVLASYSPSPATFLGGTNCTLSLQVGCLWEFDVILQEVNGVGIASATMNEVFTFGTTTFPGSLNIQIPERGTATITRNLACGTGGTACVTPAELAGGTYTYSLTGTDSNGNAFSFTGPVLTLLGQGGSGVLSRSVSTARKKKG